MLRRDVLAAAFHIFHFVQHFDGSKARWWKSARLEFRVMAGLVMAMYADPERVWLPLFLPRTRSARTMVWTGAATA